MNAAVELAEAAHLHRAEDRWLRESRERLTAGVRRRHRLAAESAQHESIEASR
jgi:hypothetical protein